MFLNSRGRHGCHHLQALGAKAWATLVIFQREHDDIAASIKHASPKRHGSEKVY